MTLKANGKRIDCGAIAHLFSQGERHADKVAFALPRYYAGWDLSGCTFALTGENAEFRTRSTPSPRPIIRWRGGR